MLFTPRLVRALLALLILTSTALGATGASLVAKTWDGSNSPDWHDPANWTPFGVPDPADEVTIPAAPVNQPQISAAPVAVHNLTVATNASLQIWSQQVDVGGNLTVNGQVMSMAGGATLNVNNGFTVSGSSASLSNPAQTNLTGNGLLTVNGNATVSPLRVVSGVRALTTGVVGELHLIGGEVHVNNGVVFTVSSLLRLQGGTLSYDTTVGNVDTIDVNGDVEVVGTVAGSNTTASRLIVGGNWTGTPSFVMSDGLVVMDTGGSSTISGPTPTFGNLEIASDVVTLVTGTQVFGDLRLTTAGRLDVGATPLTVFGDFVNLSNVGGITGTQAVVLAGDGLLQANATTQIPLAQSSGTRSVTTSTVPALAVNGGTLHINNGALLKVLGDLDLNAGTLNYDTTVGNVDTIEVDGAVRALGTVMGTTTGASVLHADGSWFANAPFVMAEGWVNFRGAAPQIGGTQPAFKRMRIQGGDLELLSDVEVSGTVEATAGGTFGAGYLELIGTVQAIGSGANLLQRLRIVSGANEISTSRVDELELLGGNLLIRNGVLLTVETEARLLGGTLDFDTTSGFNDILNVDGDLFINGTQVGTTTSATVIRVAGDWISNTPFVLPMGWVELDGDGSLIGGSERTFHRLRLVSGDRVLPQDIQITGTAVRTNGTVSGPGFIEFTGSSGESVTLAGFTVPNVRIAGGDVLMSTLTTGTLEVTGGTLNLLNGVLLRVLGDASLTGGVIDWDTTSGFQDTLQVDGDLLVDGTAVGTTTAVSRLYVSGDLTLNSPFVLPEGWIELRGTTGSILGTDRNFNRLNFFAGDVTLPEDIYISRAVKRQNGTISGPGYIEIVDDLTETVGLAGITVPFVRVSSGTAPMSTTTIGELEVTGGALVVLNGALLKVVDEARLSGGELRFDDTSGFLDVFEVVGDLIETGTTVTQSTPFSRLRLRGDFESDTGLNVAPGNTEFLGTAQTVRGANPTAHNLTVTGTILTVESSLTVSGNTTLSNATTTGPEWLELIGDGLVTTGASVAEKLRILSGDNSITTSNVGELELLGGKLSVSNGALVTVADAARLVAGELAFDTTSGFQDTLDVNGDFTQVGTVCSASTSVSRLRVAGNWSSNSSFGMANGIVELDGAGPSNVSGSLPGFDPTFHKLEIKNGVRTLVNGPALLATDVTVFNGGTLRAGASGATVSGGPISVASGGTLGVDPGGELTVDGSAPITINSGGRLELIGAPGMPAVLSGTANDLDLTVNGTLAARDFEVRSPIAAGVLLNTGASFATAPDDMRGGVFAEPDAAPGSVLLDLRPAAAKTFFFVRFDDPLGVGTFNVTRSSGSPVAFQNFGGNLSGELFEHDPVTGLIDWLPTTITQVVDFSAKPGPEEVALSLETSVEVDTAMFHLQSAPSPSGPFATVVSFPPLGAGTYAYVDTGLTADQTVHYRLVEQQTSGFFLVLADASATPYSAANPANVRTVGPGGEFATIQEAVDAAVHAQTLVRVAAGVYPSFVIDAPTVGSLHVLAEGAVTIDAGLAAVEIANLGVGQTVELHGLDIVGGAGALDIHDNAGLVLVDQVTAGASGVAVDVTDSAFVNLTRSDFLGLPGLRVGGATKAWAGAGSTDSLEVGAGVQWQTCGFTAASSTIAPGAAVTNFPGVMPELEIENFQSLCQSFTIGITAAPNSFFQLGAAGIANPLDLGAPATFQMLPILNAATYKVMTQGFVGPSGQAVQSFELPPVAAFLGQRFIAQAWAVTATPGLQVRFSNPVSVVGMP